MTEAAIIWKPFHWWWMMMMMMMMMMMIMNCFCDMVNRRKVSSLIFSRTPLSEILTIANLQHAASRIWTCAEPEFRFWRMKLYSSDLLSKSIAWFLYDRNLRYERVKLTFCLIMLEELDKISPFNFLKPNV